MRMHGVYLTSKAPAALKASLVRADTACEAGPEVAISATWAEYPQRKPDSA